jgi:hypothetical protein
MGSSAQALGRDARFRRQADAFGKRLRDEVVGNGTPAARPYGDGVGGAFEDAHRAKVAEAASFRFPKARRSTGSSVARSTAAPSRTSIGFELCGADRAA